MTHRVKENLISAVKKIYRLTIFFPKKEPLRYKIRELADEILADFILFLAENPGKKIKNELIKKLEVLDSYFEIINEQKWVSPAEILELKSFYRDLKKNIEEKESRINEENKKKETFFPENSSSPLSLSERQQKILDYLKEKEKAQVWEIKEIFQNVSKRTLRRDFQRLLKKGIIERVGEKSNTFYRLKNG